MVRRQGEELHKQKPRGTGAAGDKEVCHAEVIHPGDTRAQGHPTAAPRHSSKCWQDRSRSDPEYLGMAAALPH